MGLNLSKAKREKLESDLNAATPYSAEDMLILDGEVDFRRSKATIAKKLIDMADEKDSE